MNKIIQNSVIFFIVSILLVILTSCSFTFRVSNVGRTTLEQERMVLDLNRSKEPKSWETKALSMEYTLIPQADSVLISGSITLAPHVINSFPIVDFIKLYINFLDDNGIVLATHTISPPVGYRSRLNSSLRLSRTVSMPAESKYYAFNYWANFASESQGDDTVDYWEIFHNPFVKD